jgi:hypothetical protein
MMRFEPSVLEVLGSAEEVTIETVGDDGRPRQTIIWVVVDGQDAFVRSFRGTDGRWYRDLLAEPRATLRVAALPGGVVAVKAVPAQDDGSIERCSRALRSKYPPGEDLESMVRPATLPTTLRLEPLPG